MRAVELLVEKAAKSPFKSFIGMANDYVLYLLAVLFFLFLVVVRWPLALVDRLTGWDLRERFIKFIAYWSHA